LQVRGESFNTFNHPNPFNINTTLGSGTYGQVTRFTIRELFNWRQVIFLRRGASAAMSAMR
jgi:hypothetical protein